MPGNHRSFNLSYHIIFLNFNDLIKHILLYAMALLYIMAGVNHFRKPAFYIRIMPPYLPHHGVVNQLSGIVEIALGLLLCISCTRAFAAWAIALMLLLFFMVHVWMLQQALHQPNYYLSPAMAWFRMGLQFVLIAWALWYRK